MTEKQPLPHSIVDEFAGADFGDARLTQRLVIVASRLAAAPAESLPKSSASPSDLEATYRFFRNERVSAEAILAPHLAASRARARNVTTLLSIEDTSEVRFGGASRRNGLGDLPHGGQGFLLHAALLVGLVDAQVIPLGLGTYEVISRTTKREVTKTKAAAKAKEKRIRADPERETLRWLRVAQATDNALASEHLFAIHVADREGDNYDFFAPLAKSRFVIRLTHSRAVTNQVEGFTASAGHPRPRIDDAVAGLSVRARRSVNLSARVKSAGRHVENPRAAREAELIITSTTVSLRPPSVSDCRDCVTLNVVDVKEVNAPEGEDPVSWRLLTTEPISTEADVCRVVDIYRARWVIEEFFKALKTGCSMEKRQLETQQGLEKALAVEIPIAWQMLALRYAARVPTTPASAVLPATVLALLSWMATTPGKNRWGIKLATPTAPTAKEALWAIARIGGHLPHNGPPGWITIRRGLDDVMTILSVWEPM